MIKRIIGIAVATAFALPAMAEYPEKDITLIVPYGAGGGTDTAARLIQPHLEKTLGGTLVVTNMPGAGGTIGATKFAQSKPNGYTLAFLPAGTAVMQPNLRKVQYDEKSFAPICMTINDPVGVAVAPESPIDSLDALIAEARKRTISAAGAAPGSFSHLGPVMLARGYKVKIKYVPHEGGAKAARSALGGQVDMIADNVGLIIKFGLKPLTVMAEKRAATLPDVPTIDELGGPPIRLSIWYGLFAPAGTDPAILETLSKACKEATDLSAYQDSVKKANYTPQYMDSAAFKAFFEEQFHSNADLFKEIGLKK